MVGRAGDIRTARGGAGHTARLGTGASGWMVALAPDEETARRLLVRDVEYHGLRILEIEYEREVGFQSAGDEATDGPQFFPTQPAYRYAGGNPATHSDPEGVFILPILIVIGVGALIGGCGRSKKPKFFYCDEWDEQTRDQTKCGEMCEDVYMKGGAGFQADCLDCCREIDPNAPPQKCYAQCSEIAGRFSAPCQCDESKRGKNKPPQGPPF